MTTLNLTDTKNPELEIKLSKTLNYHDKEGNFQTKDTSTALTDSIKEIAKVVNYDKGKVTLSVQNKDSSQKDYRVEDFTTNNENFIVLIDTKEPNNKDKRVYFKRINESSFEKEHYIFNEDTTGAKRLLKNIGLSKVHLDEYQINVKATLDNNELKNDLLKEPNTCIVMTQDRIAIKPSSNHAYNYVIRQGEIKEMDSTKMYARESKFTDKKSAVKYQIATNNTHNLKSKDMPVLKEILDDPKSNLYKNYPPELKVKMIQDLRDLVKTKSHSSQSVKAFMKQRKANEISKSKDKSIER